ncbi:MULTISPECIES: peptidase T [unclassified Fusibacter]|uniref:peptidase T n=1 Tax=unclassified Fusibacter TaxID=2624464 RepID=UPI001013C260|nr:MULTISPECIES: peptidase T [unclassified Fusibacter]MCK8060102.1 peptidase T [Fusibacter sp. A2]NPE22244.1 peptidase T [Fusibacter sp. A1]RXV61018.1 peptidase T [Fusibacter sp. A1]
MESVLERFLRYVKYDTRSLEYQNQIPSTTGQLVLAKLLVDELKSLGVENATIDTLGFVIGTYPSNCHVPVPSVAFFSHLDTSPEFNGTNVSPQLVKSYDGGDIILNEGWDITLSPKMFPELLDYIGQDIVTTDGTSLLGADAKAGIAEIMTLIAILRKSPEIKHGDIHIVFTPDEELAISGIYHFSNSDFSTDFAYIIDGNGIGELSFENFNASVAKVSFTGKSIHPGQANKKMINAIHVMNDFINLLPSHERPEHTHDYEGFYFLESVKADVEEAVLSLDIRDFRQDGLEDKKKYLYGIAGLLNKKYQFNVVEVQVQDSYKNIGESIGIQHESVQLAMKAMKNIGLKPKVVPHRGGHDGTALYEKGIIAPNLFVGVHNEHGKYEFIPVQSMEKSVSTLLEITSLLAKK